MTTSSSARQLELEALGVRQVVAAFDGARVSSDGGMVLLHEVDRRTGLLAEVAQCFTDHRRSDLTSSRCAPATRT